MESIRLSLCCYMPLPTDIQVGFVVGEHSPHYLVDGQARRMAAIQAGRPLRATIRTYPSLEAMLSYFIVAQDVRRLSRAQQLAHQPTWHAQQVLQLLAQEPNHPLASRLELGHAQHKANPTLTLDRLVLWMDTWHLSPGHLSLFCRLYLSHFATPGCNASLMQRGIQQVLIQFFNLLTHDPGARLNGKKLHAFLQRLATTLTDEDNARAQKRWASLAQELSKPALWACLRKVIKAWRHLSPTALRVFEAASERPQGFIQPAIAQPPPELPSPIPPPALPISSSPDTSLELESLPGNYGLFSNEPSSALPPGTRVCEPDAPTGGTVNTRGRSCSPTGRLLQRVIQHETVQVTPRMAHSLRSGAYKKGYSLTVRPNGDHCQFSLSARAIRPHQNVNLGGHHNSGQAIDQLILGHQHFIETDTPKTTLNALRTAAYCSKKKPVDSRAFLRATHQENRP